MTKEHAQEDSGSTCSEGYPRYEWNRILCVWRPAQRGESSCTGTPEGPTASLK
jgi:hypothetical protein